MKREKTQIDPRRKRTKTAQTNIIQNKRAIERLMSKRKYGRTF
jgi:hypothetical protein